MAESFEKDLAFLYLSRPYLDVEVAALVRDFEDFRPCESIYPQSVAVY